MADTLPTSNASEWTVSELSGALRRTIEDSFGYVRLRGEIGGFRGQHGSGHCYFSLKDEGAKIDAVIWKGTYARLKVKPQEGLEVIATGKITTFPGKSSYQIIVDAIEPAGVGALMALLEQRKKKLAAEGLFAEERKRPLPYLPSVIGVVTSPTGAVIRDILHRLEDRFSRHVLVWPARVQGETCAAEVAAGIRGFNALQPNGRIPRPDVIIVARGGGSIEDLWGFNDEDLVRAAAQSAIPLVAAVGHETDWTLIDLVADRRAPTPTGAAEMVVPVRAELAALVNDLARRHAEAMLRGIDRRKADLRGVARALPSADDILAQKRQRLDLAAARLGPALARNARSGQARFVEACRRLERASPRIRLAGARARLDAIGERPAQLARRLLQLRRERLFAVHERIIVAQRALVLREKQRLERQSERVIGLGERLRGAHRAQIERRAAALAGLWQLAASLGYEAVLARGYALVRGEDGSLVRSARDVAPGMVLSLRFADGEAQALGAGAARAPKKKERGERAGQGSLFEA